MDTAKLFKSRGSQAVRLPKGYGLPGDEVYVRKVGAVLVLIPKDVDPWKPFVDSLDKFSDDFMDFKRDQGAFERHGAIRGTTCSTPTSAFSPSRRNRWWR
jgi:antitoxin VapB